MRLFPAIDVISGKAVRLLKGNYADMTVYNDDICAVACDFKESGAKFMHVVDLEAAKSGTPTNADVIIKAASVFGGFTEVGGGIRDMQTCEYYLANGISRVILGTAAIKDKAFLREAAKNYGERIAVGADARGGFIAVNGWTEETNTDIFAFCGTLADIGIKTVICTDISRDGALGGIDSGFYATLVKRTGLEIIASGGVTGYDDIKALKSSGVAGAIIGKAYYTGSIDLKEALRIAQ